MEHFGFSGIFFGLAGLCYIIIIALVFIFAWRFLRAFESIADSISKMVEQKKQQAS